MSMSELLRVHVHPGFKEVVREVAEEHGQSVAEFVREAVSARAREYLGVDEVEFRRAVSNWRRRPRRGRRG